MLQTVLALKNRLQQQNIVNKCKLQSGIYNFSKYGLQVIWEEPSIFGILLNKDLKR